LSSWRKFSFDTKKKNKIGNFSKIFINLLIIDLRSLRDLRKRHLEIKANMMEMKNMDKFRCLTLNNS
jgi:hypothetical protein